MINVIKNIFLYTLIAASVLVFAQQKATGVGYGLTKDAAVEQAKRDAVEQGLGAYMTSTTTVTALSIEDNIFLVKLLSAKYFEKVFFDNVVLNEIIFIFSDF